MAETYEVTVGAGTLRSTDPQAHAMPHRWTDEGVTLETSFTGAHLLHTAVAGCVLNDLYREAAGLGITLDGVRVTAHGSYDDDWRSHDVAYAVDLDTTAEPNQVELLLETVDTVAEVPRALRHGVFARRLA